MSELRAPVFVGATGTRSPNGFFPARGCPCSPRAAVCSPPAQVGEHTTPTRLGRRRTECGADDLGGCERIGRVGAVSLEREQP